ncbi:MAG: aminotransferase class III-fold pyridoxal phosphate-dependent enzyme, partial [Muribaculaceae bacterium]|nr:aminotransferase class III-fold pyridoxal phosphate-dependent enzyme [Muribaculaceae bacterium]
LNDIEAVRTELAKGDVAAVIFEPIQGVGGIRMATDDFMRQLRDITRQTGTVLIADEIQCGYGRSGKFFAHQWAGIRPDIITVAKGIANGYPFSGVLISPEFEPVYGMLGTTFGGNHLGCAVAGAVLDIMEDEKLVENAQEIGDYLISRLKELPGIKEVRGRGLMIGIEFDNSAKELRRRLIFDEHIFTGAAGTNIIRLLPPLCLSRAEADEFLEKFTRQFQKGL